MAHASRGEQVEDYCGSLPLGSVAYLTFEQGLMQAGKQAGRQDKWMGRLPKKGEAKERRCGWMLYSLRPNLHAFNVHSCHQISVR